MPYLFKKLLSRGSRGPLIFFALFYLYLWLWIKPCVIYHGGGELTNYPVFFTGWTFFHETVWFPGGFIKYLSAFLSQLLYLNWAGAIVLTIHAWLIYVSAGFFLRAIKTVRFRLISFIPVILLLAIYNKYTYHFTTTTALLAALAFLCVYVKTAPKSKLLNVLLFAVLSIILYVIAGGAFLLFALVCGLYEILFRRRFNFGLLCLLSAAILPYLAGVLVFNISIIDAYCNLLPLSWEVTYFPGHVEMIKAVYALYLFLPVIVILSGLWQNFTAKAIFKSSLRTPSKPASVAEYELIAVFLIAAAAIYYSYDSERKTVFEVDYYACCGNWRKVITASRGGPSNHLTVHISNRALYHTGRLPYDMFGYPQQMSFLLLTQYEYQYWQRFFTLYDLGTLGHCERELMEALETYGERPVILKQLALVKMAEGDLPSARIYLGALSKTLFHSNWAKYYLRQLESDPTLSADKEIPHLRSIMPEEDEGSPYSIEKIFSVLLEKNRRNQMAFEYMMAGHMLSRQLNKFARNLSRLDDFDYPQIPRYYEEAILIYEFETKKEVNLNGRSISDESRLRFKDFLWRFYLYGANRQLIPADMEKLYGDSYFFYYFYRTSGAKHG